MAADPTYPLYPVASILAATALCLVLFTSFVRQRWNFGIASLCFWLFWENLLGGVNAVIWSDNFDIKLRVYCDIYSRLELIAYVVKPMSTLIIIRRLYLIASNESVDLPSKAARRWDTAIEWTLGLAIPLLVAGPLYYIVEGYRFQVLEGFGCTNAQSDTVLTILFIQIWGVLPPLLSIIFYYPRVARFFYRQTRLGSERSIFTSDSSDSTVSRTSYLRILTLASVDVLFTLPIGIVSLVLFILPELAGGPIPFYYGWVTTHADFAPEGFSYAEVRDTVTVALAQTYFTYWVPPILAFVIFGLFGLTTEARASYRRTICVGCEWFGCTIPQRSVRTRSVLSTIRFGTQTQEVTLNATLDAHPNTIAYKLNSSRQDDDSKTRSIACGDASVVEKAEERCHKSGIIAV
ncbi:unnamed protein product [Peniophora sp. CBMAI 1063]|nr:unnamed protein product [Peniophora sp. CBMAI 1063]